MADDDFISDINNNYNSLLMNRLKIRIKLYFLQSDQLDMGVLNKYFNEYKNDCELKVYKSSDLEIQEFRLQIMFDETSKLTAEIDKLKPEINKTLIKVLNNIMDIMNRILGLLTQCQSQINKTKIFTEAMREKKMELGRVIALTSRNVILENYQQFLEDSTNIVINQMEFLSQVSIDYSQTSTITTTTTTTTTTTPTQYQEGQSTDQILSKLNNEPGSLRDQSNNNNENNKGDMKGDMEYVTTVGGEKLYAHPLNKYLSLPKWTSSYGTNATWVNNIRFPSPESAFPEMRDDQVGFRTVIAENQDDEDKELQQAIQMSYGISKGFSQ